MAQAYHLAFAALAALLAVAGGVSCTSGGRAGGGSGAPARSVAGGSAKASGQGGSAGAAASGAPSAAPRRPPTAAKRASQRLKAAAAAAAGARGTLVVQINAMPRHLGAVLGSADVWCHRIAMHNIYEPLLRRLHDGSYRVHLAADMKIERGGRRYRFVLRSGIHFHDGRPLTAADVRYTIDRIRSRRSPNRMLRAALGRIVDVRDPNPLTVIIELARPNYLLPAALTQVPILPAHYHKRWGIYNARVTRKPIGTGPFMLDGEIGRDRLKLVRNDNYWGRRPALAEVHFRAISEPSKALTALRNGEVDIVSDLYPHYYPHQIRRERAARSLQVRRIYPHHMRVLWFNSTHGPLRDRRVRVALTRLIDRQTVLRKARGKLGQLLSAPLWPLSRWYNRTLHPRDYSEKAAGRLLDMAGWRMGKRSGKRAKVGHPLVLELMRARKSPVQTGLRSTARKLGVRVVVKLADFGYLRSRLRHKRFQLALSGLTLRPEVDLRPLLHSRGSLNFGGYKNPLVDSLLDKLRTTPSSAARVRLARRLHRALFDDPPLAVIFAPIQVLLANVRVKGLRDHGTWPRLIELSTPEPIRPVRVAKAAKPGSGSARANSGSGAGSGSAARRPSSRKNNR